MAYDSQTFTDRKFSIACVLAGAVAIYVGVFFLSVRMDLQWAHDEATEEIQEMTTVLRRGTAAQFEVVRALGSLMETQDNVTRDQFHKFVRGTLERHPGIRALEWVPLVEHTERAMFEAAAREAGLSRGQIVERNGDADMVVAGVRERYFPVSFIEPLEGNEPAVLYDLASDAQRFATIERARRTGELVITAPIKLIQKSQSQSGFLLLLPVYHKENEHHGPNHDVLHLKGEITGIVLGVYEADALLTIASNTNALSSLQVFDVTNYQNVKCIHTSQQFREACSAPTQLLKNLRGGRSYESELSVAGRDWLLLGGVEGRPLFRLLSSTTWSILLSGAGLVILLATYLLSLWSKKEAIEDTVRDRTTELYEANNRLQFEIEQKDKANVDLLASKEHLKKIIDQSPHPIIIMHELLGEIYYANTAALKLFKVEDATLDDVLSAKFFANPEHQQDLRGKFIRVGSFSAEEVLMRKFTGEIFEAEVYATPIVFEGHPCAYTVVSDISARKQIERQKNEFVSTVSHELKTPLSAIIGSLDLLGGGVAGETSSKAKSLIDIALKNSERLDRIVDGMLDIRRIEAGLTMINRQDVLPADILSDAIEASRAIFVQHGVEVRSENDVDEPVFVDKDLIVQVITNFLSNAAKFSPHGTSVTIRVMKSTKRIRFSVEDEGAGIDRDFQPFVFDRFTQADASDARQRGGSGLGLSICKTIAEAHSADIGFETTTDVGSLFYIDLDITKSAGARAPVLKKGAA